MLKVPDSRTAGVEYDMALRERKLMLQCKKISGMTHLVDCFTEKNNMCMLFERPKGDSLRDSVKRLGKSHLKESEVRKIISQILSILKYLHRKRIRHLSLIHI